MQLFWHRDDLRVDDNVGVTAAATSAGPAAGTDAGPSSASSAGTAAADESEGLGPVVPVFVFDDAVLEHASPNRVAFMLDALAELRADYRDLGSDLVLRHGDPRTELVELADAVDADRVVWNRGHSGLARDRDAAVRDALADADIAQTDFEDAILHEPGSITTNEGTPYQVYTYFWKKWRDRDKPAPHDLPDPATLWTPADEPGATDGHDPGALDASVEAAVEVGDMPEAADLGFGEPTADAIPAAGTAAARERLESFLESDVYEYADRRDYPAEDCTSHLSVDLKWGTIGIREVHEAVAAARDLADTEADHDSVEAFRSQLAWREFYTHVLHYNPEVVTENYVDYAQDIAWRDPDADADVESELEAWKHGQTGYPIVDAGMRQLREEGFVHNRVRMIVASFLTKDLLVDWREGYAHYRDHLVDHDTANDNGGWQWAASTGTDAQPYFRIFNPMTQGADYDPDAAYITTYVPELDGVPPEVIHSWHECKPTQREASAPDYPAPIVDHGDRRERAIAMFEAARGN